MEDKTHIQVSNLLYSCVEKKQRSNESFVAEHTLGYILSGESHLKTNDGVKVFGPGTVGLVRRNLLIKADKVPPAGGGEFKAVNLFLTQDFLRRYSALQKLPPAAPYKGEPMQLVSDDPFIKGYVDSLLSYVEHPGMATPAMLELKTREAVELLLRMHAGLYDFLFDFSEPHKIDLEDYMNRHYMYNVSAVKFARLTGRSLAGFKRDFEKIFHTSPGQWLQQRRLAEAYYLIKEKGQKPSEVYLDVGFENLSHFSYSFKKAYGVAPSRVQG